MVDSAIILQEKGISDGLSDTVAKIHDSVQQRPPLQSCMPTVTAISFSFDPKKQLKSPFCGLSVKKFILRICAET